MITPTFSSFLYHVHFIECLFVRSYHRLFYYEAYQEDEIPYLDSKAVARTFEEMKQEYEGEYLLNQIKQFFDAYTLQSTKVSGSSFCAD